MRKYKCYYCGAIIDHFLYLYDSSPRGDDEAVCPKCRRDDGFEEVKEKKEEPITLTDEQITEMYESGYISDKEEFKDGND